MSHTPDLTISPTVSQKLTAVRKQLNKNPGWKNFSVEKFIAEKRKEAQDELDQQDESGNLKSSTDE